MRAVVLALVLSGCQAVFSYDVPPRDGSPVIEDASPDGPEARGCQRIPTFPPGTPLIQSLAEVEVAADDSFAIVRSLDGQLIALQPIATSGNQGQPVAGMWLRIGMSPDASELVLQDQNGLSRASRSDAPITAWGQPVPQVGLSLEYLVGSPRNLAGSVVVEAGGTQLIEYERQETSWFEIETSPVGALAPQPEFPPGARVFDPALSGDGEVLTYVIIGAGALSGIHHARRTPNNAFEHAGLLLPGMNVTSPQLVADCSVLYYLENAELKRSELLPRSRTVP